MKKTRDIVFILLGVAGLLLKRHYSGPLDELVHAYLGNIAASFAVYFNANLLPFQWKHRGIVSACLALAVVESFEATNGFGIMSNTFDPFDFLANALGIAVALTLDTMLNRNQTAQIPVFSGGTLIRLLESEIQEILSRIADMG